jgi:hypothetical protein
MKHNLWVVWIGIFLILCSSVFATPSIRSTITTEQLDIVPELIDSYKVNTFAELNFHVYNSSGMMMTNETSLKIADPRCFIHIYNQDGTHFIKKELYFNKDDGDFFIDLNATNTSRFGIYPYMVWCNGTRGGWIDSQFYVTEQAINVPVDKYPHYDLILIFGLLAMAFFFIYFSEKFKIEGSNASKAISALIINLLFKLTAFAIIVFDLFFIRNLLPSITSISVIYDAMLPVVVYGVGLLFFLLYFVNSIITLVMNYQVLKENKKKEKEDYK